MTASSYSATEDARERLRRAARLSEKTEAPRMRAELRSDRGDHRRGAAARGPPGVVVGDVAQPAGEDAAARGLPRRRLHRHQARGRQEGAVQADEVRDKLELTAIADRALRHTFVLGRASGAVRIQMASIAPLLTDRWIASKLRTFASISSSATG